MRVELRGPQPLLAFLSGPSGWVVTLEKGRATYGRLDAGAPLLDCPMHVFEIEVRGRKVKVSDGERTYWTGVLSGDFEVQVRALRRVLKQHGSPDDVPDALRNRQGG